MLLLRHSTRFMSRPLPRMLLPSVILLGVFWLGAGRLSEISLFDLTKRLTEISAAQWLGAFAAALIAYLAAAAQERAVVAHLGLRLDPSRARGAAMAAAAVAQTVGFGPIVGAIVRRRLLPSLSMRQSFEISAGITLAFLLGLGLLTLGTAAFGPETGYRSEARILLVVLLLTVATASVLPSPTIRGLRRPSVITLLRLGGWVSLDCLALCLVFWSLLLPTARPDLLVLLPTFLLGLGIGLASGCPAGAGPFEAVMALHLPALETNDLLASLLAFRCVAYALPALFGATWALLGPSILGREREAELAPGLRLPDRDLRALPWAEGHLVRQGDLGLLGGRRGTVWVSKALGLCRLYLGDPQAAYSRPMPFRDCLAAARDLAQREARSPLLYKIGSRSASIARNQGWAVLPIAREAVLEPARFYTSGSSSARLRRKLRAAEKAGISVEWPSVLPVSEMEAVSDEWVRRRGGERRLSMGRWTRDYVEGQRVAVTRDKSGRLLAFVSFHASNQEWTLDLMRSRDEAPDGTLYLLIVTAIRQAALNGVPRLSLAAVPEETFGLTGPLAWCARRATHASKGLQQFKQAFHPRWERRYMAAPTRYQLALGALELALTIRPARSRSAGIANHSISKPMLPGAMATCD